MAKTALTHDQQFMRLCENGFGFVSKAIEQLWENGSPDALKYSVINFYSGVELLLKARLMHEHWSLIVADPNKADIDEFLNGEAQTVGLKQAVHRLKKVAQVTVPPNAINSFEELRKHRNRMVHFYHLIDIEEPDQEKQREAVILEQCRGWFYLRRLLGDDWAEVFAAFQQQVADINMSMKRHREYLGAVYAQIQPELEAARQGGANLAVCSACGFEAHVLDYIGPHEHKCRVCLAKESFLLHDCPNEDCGSKILLPIEECETWACSDCGTSIELSDVLYEYTIEGKADHDDPNQAALCTECSHIPETAGTLDNGETIFCFNCFCWPEKIEYCEWCNEPFTGNAEGTYWSGCERCDGQVGSARDD
ncbi:hypothetical protein FHS21_002806 [Phyllobacterium trifolii]|uniref:HsdR n=1 Tax=Phyllobacterium trifolii TaxID=300193 RepID=A0A839UCI1_9HYPH|nr:hypothetical protein [Phyllobacterium trifolii]MBB3146391.1 hypothetical protein [Phyllobacterium trifolii]